MDKLIDLRLSLTSSNDVGNLVLSGLHCGDYVRLEVELLGLGVRVFVDCSR